LPDCGHGKAAGTFPSWRLIADKGLWLGLKDQAVSMYSLPSGSRST
jgi:hypothetical protein